MDATVSTHDAAFALPASVTMADASASLRGLETALAQGSGPLRVDAAALDELDTAAIALLLQVQRLAADRGRRVELLSPPAKLVALAQLYGVASLLSLPDSDRASASSASAA